jgi:hypothetical protein
MLTYADAITPLRAAFETGITQHTSAYDVRSRMLTYALHMRSSSQRDVRDRHNAGYVSVRQHTPMCAGYLAVPSCLFFL